MSNRKWLWIFGVLAVVVAIFLAVIKLNKNRYEAAFQEQLRLARAEGIPTSAAEFAASIQPAKPEENAAPFYRQLYGMSIHGADPDQLTRDLVFRPSKASFAKVEKLLAEFDKVLKIADAAVLRRRCWFDRDWSKGPAVLMPEFADMKTAAKFLALRASVAAFEGRAGAALEDIGRIKIIARHAGEESTAISHLVSESIYFIALRNLIYWLYREPGHPAYSAALKIAIDELPKPDPKREFSGDLYSALTLIDLCSTREGREELGLKPEEIGAAETIIPIFMNQREARIKVVKAQRAMWASYDLPMKERVAAYQAATDDFNAAIFAFPTAAKVYGVLWGGATDSFAMRPEIWAARRMQVVAAYRALGHKRIPRSIRTDDLLSPFDGKPATYTYDGKQFAITVSGFMLNDARPNVLKIPPTNAMKK